MTRVQAIGRRSWQFGIAVALLAGLPYRLAPISAQIYEWVDDAGARHFDTSLEQVPEAQRAQARIVVAAPTPGSAEEASGARPSTALERNTGESETDNSYDAGWDAGFGAGWQAGYRAAAEEAPECPVEPQVVALESRPPVVISLPVYDPSGAYYRSPYGGMLTVPFDDGASRGLTGRSRIQDQRALERGW